MKTINLDPIDDMIEFEVMNTTAEDVREEYCAHQTPRQARKAFEKHTKPKRKKLFRA